MTKYVTEYTESTSSAKETMFVVVLKCTLNFFKIVSHPCTGITLWKQLLLYTFSRYFLNTLLCYRFLKHFTFHSANKDHQYKNCNISISPVLVISDFCFWFHSNCDKLRDIIKNVEMMIKLLSPCFYHFNVCTCQSYPPCMHSQHVHDIIRYKEWWWSSGYEKILVPQELFHGHGDNASSRPMSTRFSFHALQHISTQLTE